MTERRSSSPDDWRSETAGDIESAQNLLASALSSLAGEPNEEQVGRIWTAYVLVEKSVGFIKVELEEENPGRFINTKVYSIPDERQAVGFALKSIRAASDAFRDGRLREALKALRDSRNYLRVLLRRKRLLRARRARAAGA
jgi:hypothetical protein